MLRESWEVSVQIFKNLDQNIHFTQEQRNLGVIADLGAYFISMRILPAGSKAKHTSSESPRSSSRSIFFWESGSASHSANWFSWARLRVFALHATPCTRPSPSWR
jgi:hypothetical protein